MTRSAQVPLGDILSVTTGWVISLGFPESMVQLVQHVVQTELNPFIFPAAIEATKDHLFKKMPWLLGLSVPAWMDEEKSNLKLWCWLDQKEMRYGNLQVVESMAPGEWTPPTLVMSEIEYVCPDGHVHRSTYEELPEEVQQLLRQLGMEPD